MDFAELFSSLLPRRPLGLFGDPKRSGEEATKTLYEARANAARGAYAAFLDGNTTRVELLQALLQGGVALGLAHELPVEDFVNTAATWRARVKANASSFLEKRSKLGETTTDARKKLEGLTFRVSNLSAKELTDALAALCCLSFFDSCREETRHQLEGELGKRFDAKCNEFRQLLSESTAPGRRESGFFSKTGQQASASSEDRARGYQVGQIQNKTAFR